MLLITLRIILFIWRAVGHILVLILIVLVVAFLRLRVVAGSVLD